MPAINFFPANQVVGVFRGFQDGGLEFHADLVLPYRNDFQSVPMHGQFLLVQLETPNEAVLGRISSLSAEGKLAVGSGEEFTIRAVRENRSIPEDLREQYLKYRVNIRVLGVLRSSSGSDLIFVASHRRLPHVGSPVAFPSPEVLKEIAGHNVSGTPIGHLAYGEYIYAAGSQDLELQPWMQLETPQVLIRFPTESLVSRRSFIFARAGFGKSNLNKLLFSRLYEQTPTVTKRGGRQVPVGTVIFDPDGEYFWPDDRGRPGLCDVPELRDQLVVFTARQPPSAFYGSFVAGGIKLDIRRLRPADVIGIALDPERQDQQNVRKLRSLNQVKWEELVNLIDEKGHSADLDEVRGIIDLEKSQQLEALAARANMAMIVRQLHDKSSQLMDLLIRALSQGKLCVVDVSQMRRGQALILSGLILRRIFDRNQDGFTSARPDTIPTIAVIEEAQAVLNEKSSAAEPYITWVKEGRKYDLGAVLVTQQPGSIPAEILSQGDNWFLFHLLSTTDLQNVKRANAHFSDDLLSSLLNEPIPGQGVFWSSASGKPYPVSIRALSFERMYALLDPNYDRPSIDTFARRLRAEFEAAFEQLVPVAIDRRSSAESSMREGNGSRPDDGVLTHSRDVASPIDLLAAVELRAADALRNDLGLMDQLERDGVAWGTVKALILTTCIPETFEDRENLAFKLVSTAMTKVFGPQNQGWHSFKHGQRSTTYVKMGSP